MSIFVHLTRKRVAVPPYHNQLGFHKQMLRLDGREQAANGSNDKSISPWGTPGRKRRSKAANEDSGVIDVIRYAF